MNDAAASALPFLPVPGFDVYCEWGPVGLAALRRYCAVLVIVDVFSFSSAVDVAVSRGAQVYPCPVDGEPARQLAESIGGVLAVHRREAGYSLAPASLLAIPQGTRLVLPSLNGSALSASAGQTTTLAGCLRNANAVARAAARLAAVAGGPVGVIAAGERWPDGSLRPALEDWLGAGAITASLPGRLSPEAQSAAVSFRSVQGDLPAVLAGLPSGLELRLKDPTEDLSLFSEWNASDSVPILVRGAYTRYIEN